MKKVLLFFIGVVISFAANRYPILFEYHYLKGCMSASVGKNIKIKESARENFCICTLRILEKKYTLNDIFAKFSDPTERKKIIDFATNKCFNNLIK